MLRQRRQEDLPWFFHISADLFDRIDNIRQLGIVLADLCAVFLFQFIVPPGGIELRVEPSRIRDLCDEHRGLYIEIPIRAGIGGLEILKSRSCPHQQVSTSIQRHARSRRCRAVDHLFGRLLRSHLKTDPCLGIHADVIRDRALNIL